MWAWLQFPLNSNQLHLVSYVKLLSISVISSSIKDPALHPFLPRLLLQPSWYTWPTPSVHIRWLSVFFSLGIISASVTGLSTPTTPALNRLASMPVCLASSHSVLRSALLFPQHLVSCPWMNSFHLCTTCANRNKSWSSSPATLCHMPGFSSSSLATSLHII